MRTRRSSAIRRTVLFVAIAALGIAYYVIHLKTSESLYTNRNTFAYRVTISQRIQEMPEVGPVTSPARFYYTAGDGPKLPESAVSYTTTASAADIRTAVESYATSHGCQSLPPAESTFSYRCSGGSTVWLEMASESGATRVTVRETE